MKKLFQGEWIHQTKTEEAIPSADNSLISAGCRQTWGLGEETLSLHIYEEIQNRKSSWIS